MKGEGIQSVVIKMVTIVRANRQWRTTVTDRMDKWQIPNSNNPDGSDCD